MAKKRASVIVTGMNRDAAKSVYDGKLTFENRNIRVSPRDKSNSSLSVTNERGTELLDAQVFGTPVGSFTCDKYFGVFSYDDEKDYVTVYTYDDGKAEQFFQWSGAGLGFKDVKPEEKAIETVVSVEAENSIRVYWVDGVHELRVIDFMRLHENIGVDYTKANEELKAQKAKQQAVIDKYTNLTDASDPDKCAVTSELKAVVDEVAYYDFANEIFEDVFSNKLRGVTERATLFCIYKDWCTESYTDGTMTVLETIFKNSWDSMIADGDLVELTDDSTKLTDYYSGAYEYLKGQFITSFTAPYKMLATAMASYEEELSKYYTDGELRKVTEAMKSGRATAIKRSCHTHLHNALSNKCEEIVEKVEEARKAIDEIEDEQLAKNINADYFSYLPVIYPVKDVTVLAGSNGSFRSGTVQFCATEVVNGNESNVVWSSPLYYCRDLSNGRAFAPDNESAGNNFKVSFSLTATSETGFNVDFVIVYAIYRSSKDAAPIVVKQETKVARRGLTVSVNMTGSEEAVDSDYLLMLNRRMMTRVASICEKDGLLFIGGYAYDTPTLPDSITLPEGVDASDSQAEMVYGDKKTFSLDSFNGRQNSHVSQLDKDSYVIGHFKKGESYALGVQVQDKRGYWSDPVPVVTGQGSYLHTMYKAPKTEDGKVMLPSFMKEIDVTAFGDGVIAVRPVVAYMEDSQKRVLYQGMVTPTIFCEKERAEGQVYAKLSPFTRTMKPWAQMKLAGESQGGYDPAWETVNPGRIVEGGIDGESASNIKTLIADVYRKSLFDPTFINSHLYSALGYQLTSNDAKDASDTVGGISTARGTYPASQHLAALGTTKDYNCEMQTSWYYRDVVFKSAMIPCATVENGASSNDADSDDSVDTVSEATNSDVLTHDNAGYYVDARTMTFHSPDIDNTTVVVGSKVNIVGAITMQGFASDTSIVATTPTLPDPTEYGGGKMGFQHIQLGSSDAGGRCAMNLPNWCSVYRPGQGWEMAQYWGVPPFGVDDYLGAELDQSKEDNKERTSSKLTYKQLVNYRYSSKSSFFEGSKSSLSCDIKTADGTEEGVVVFGDDTKIYKPAENVIIAPSVTSMWTNGPYYTHYSLANVYYVLGKPYDKDELSSDPLGICSINKFNSRDLGWEWAMYATIFLRKKNDINPLFHNYVNLLSLVHGETYPGYWRHGGTCGSGVTCDGESILGKALSSGKAGGYDKGFNYYNYKKVNVGDSKSAGERFDDNHLPASYTVRLKYRSTPHAVITRKDTGPFPNYGGLVNYANSYANNNNAKLFVMKGWNGGDEIVPIGYDDYNLTDGSWSYWDLPDSTDKSDSLWLVDIINNSGTPKFDKSVARWVVAGDAVMPEAGKAKVEWMQGDWFYQRWDCLRTYPKSVEDPNQVVEIVSFMCETRRNVDGRYDSHIGQPFLQANPDNFNLINEAYSQQNNFFSYTMKSDNDNVVDSFPTYIAWSLPKSLNANVDTWTSLSAMSTLSMEGRLGPVTRLIKFDNNIYCFQPSAVSLISYNGRTQLTAADGMPIELAASASVNGKYLLTDKRGATSDVAIVATDSALYFADEYNKTLCAFTQRISPLSDTLGFHAWTRAIDDFRFHAFIDPRTGSVLFDRVGGDGVALSYNELYGKFESFLDCGGAALTMVVTGDTLAFHKDTEGAMRLWRIGTGRYNEFYGVTKPFWIDYLITSDKQTDKVFNNIEFNGDVLDDEGKLITKRCPYNYVRAYSEYQDSGWRKLDFTRDAASNSKNLYRIWRCFVPRDASASKPGKVAERMRNPWMHIVLKYDPTLDDEEERNRQVEIQNINVDYNEM